MRRIRSTCQVVIGFVAAALGAVAAATTTTVVDVPVDGGTQRFLYIRPDVPVATMVYMPGGDGLLGIDSVGAMAPNVANCDPVVRNSSAFAAHGIALALVDSTSNGRVRQYADVHEVIRYVRSRDSVSTWMMGISAGTSATVDLTVDSPTAEVQGVVFLSPYGSQLRASLIKVPTLLVYHGSDQYSGPFVDPLFDGLIGAPAKERVVFGGGEGGGCGLSYHLFFGFDTEMVTAVADFVLKYSPPPAVNIGPGFTGAWYDPAQSGHGLFLEVLNSNSLLAWWFTFSPDGAQSWFGGVGTYSGNTATISQGSVNETLGGKWIPNFDPAKITNVGWGTLTFTFTDCDHGRVDFTSIVPGYGNGSMNLTRLTLPAGLTCP